MTVEPSRIYLAAIVLVHALAALAAFSNALPLWLQGLLFCAVLLSLVGLVKRTAYPAPGEVARVAWTPDFGWRLGAQGTDDTPVRLLGSSVVTIFVTILHFRDEHGKRHEVVVFRDAVNRETYRRLRVLLRTTGADL